MEYFPGFIVPVNSQSWVSRMEAGCQAVEQLFSITLEQAHSGTKNNATKKAITNRHKFFEKLLKTKTRWFSVFTGSGYHRTPQGFQNNDYFCLGCKIYYEEEQFNLSITTPPQSFAIYEQLLISLGDAIEAHSAQFTPRPFAERVRYAHWCTVFGDRGLRHVLPGKLHAESSLPLNMRKRIQRVEGFTTSPYRVVELLVTGSV
jgi:hypothetical protein